MRQPLNDEMKKKMRESLLLDITKTNTDFISAGFRAGDILFWPGGPSNEKPGHYVIVSVQSGAELIVRGIGFIEGVKFYFRKFISLLRELWNRR